MTPEDYYKRENYPVLDKFDKKAPKFDYYDVIQFADEYHKEQLSINSVVKALPSKTEMNWLAIEEVEKLRLLPDYDGKQDEIIGFNKGFSKCYEILTK